MDKNQKREAVAYLTAEVAGTASLGEFTITAKKGWFTMEFDTTNGFMSEARSPIESGTRTAAARFREVITATAAQ